MSTTTTTGDQSLQLTEDQSRANNALREQTYAIAFETFLERVADGLPLDTVCREYHTPIVPSRFRSWVYRDEKRKQAYMVAKAIGAEAIEDELLRISDGVKQDGSMSMDDVQRSTLRINTRKWLLGVWNRRRYGEVKHIEQTTTTRVDPSTMSKADLERAIMDSLGLGNDDGGSIFDGEGFPLG
jgi:hypothetical protein